tara:strand:+ start:1907 stop:2200 length:294 start_codon:yes stop_codon:yes gene_type:complete
MLFEQFLISELKDIFIYVKLNYGILKNYKIYKLNKNDVIIIMRNSKLFDESIEGLIQFNYGKHLMHFKPILKKTKYYRGLQTNNLTILNKKIIIEFD